ncbi:hypothetical protein ACTPOE_09465 [Castellaniella sp. WN]
MIRTRLRKTIGQELADDPYAQKVFGELLRQAIAEAEAMFDHPLKQYALFKSFENQLEARATPDMPDVLADKPHAKAYFGAMRLVLGDDPFAALSGDTMDRLVQQAIAMDTVVRDAVAKHSLNPQNIEAAIRKGLLPLLFDTLGLDNAKRVVEQVIQITRVGLNRSCACRPLRAPPGTASSMAMKSLPSACAVNRRAPRHALPFMWNRMRAVNHCTTWADVIV